MATVTLKQIALRCQCSVATASKALNGMPDISPETSMRIREIASQMGYMPNAAARALKTRRTRNIGLFTTLQKLNGVTCDYISKIVISFQAKAEENGYDVSLLSGGGIRTQNGMSYLAHCKYRNFDGVAIICTTYEALHIHDLLQSSIPSVTVDHNNDLHSMVMTDNDNAMRQAIDYLYSRGHRRIAFIHGDESLVTRVRLAGFYRACQAYGLPVEEAFVRPAIFNDGESTASAACEIMRSPNPPTAILFPDDLAYLGALEKLSEMGISVPRDVSAVGFDGIYISQAIHPKLCTIRQDAASIGSTAFRLLKEEVENPKTFLPQRMVLPGVLLPGETVAQI